MIRQMSTANPLWGAPRIHAELQMLGIAVSQATVSRYLVRPEGSVGSGTSQTWKAFLSNHVRDIVAIDFFTVPTATFRVLHVLVVLAHDRRRILHVNVTEHPTGRWTVRQILEAFPWMDLPRFVLRDGSGGYGWDYREGLKSLAVTDLVTSPGSPWQNAYVERVIGSIRRECTDHVIVINEAHLLRVLREYVEYYNECRTHLSLAKNSPIPRPLEPLKGPVCALPKVGGLHHRYTRKVA